MKRYYFYFLSLLLIMFYPSFFLRRFPILLSLSFSCYCLILSFLAFLSVLGRAIGLLNPLNFVHCYFDHFQTLYGNLILIALTKAINYSLILNYYLLEFAIRLNKYYHHYFHSNSNSHLKFIFFLLLFFAAIEYIF